MKYYSAICALATLAVAVLLPFVVLMFLAALQAQHEFAASMFALAGVVAAVVIFLAPPAIYRLLKNPCPPGH